MAIESKKMAWTSARVDPLCSSHRQLRVLVEVHALVAAWTKAMNLDRIEGA
jgi:catalase (peroxidase I)